MTPRTSRLKAELMRLHRDLFDRGKAREAEALYDKLRARSCDRKNLALLADAANRLSRPEEALSLLVRVVRPGKGTARTGGPASAMEKAVYGRALLQLGANSEATKLLASIAPQTCPYARFFLGFAQMRSWDWEGAFSSGREYLAVEKEPHVRVVFARTMMAKSLMQASGDIPESRKILEEALLLSREMQAPLAEQECRLFLAQNAFHRGDDDAAMIELNRLAELVAGTGYAEFFTLHGRVWRALVSWRQARTAEARRAADAEARAASRGFAKIRRWEDWRASELARASLVGDEDALVQLWFGSPYPSLKARVERLLGERELARHFDWALEPSGKGAGAALLISAASGENNLGLAFLKQGQVSQRLLQALASDFYRPAYVAELHERLFPGEYFNVESSPLRVHQAVHRLREWFEENDLPLAIEESLGFYRLAAGGRSSTVRVVREERRSSVEVRRELQRLREKAAGAEFKAEEAAEWLAISRSSAVRLLREAVDRGALKKQGKGPGTRYRFARS